MEAGKIIVSTQEDSPVEFVEDLETYSTGLLYPHSVLVVPAQPPF